MQGLILEGRIGLQGKAYTKMIYFFGLKQAVWKTCLTQLIHGLRLRPVHQGIGHKLCP